MKTRFTKRPFSRREFKNIYSRVPRAAVTLAIKSEGGIIFTRRAPDRTYGNQWHLPGGTIYYKEKIEKTIKRVAQEEIGIDVKNLGLIGYIEYPSEEKERGYGWSADFVFICKQVGNKKITLNQEATEAGVFDKIPENTIKEQAMFLKNRLKDIIN